MNVLARLVAAIGVIVMWAYARACRDRNITRRRLARANLLRAVTTRLPHHKDGGCDRTVTVDITPDTTKLDELHIWWSSDDELPPALQGVPPEAIASWAAHFGHKLTPYEQQLAARSFALRRQLTPDDIEIPHTLGHLFDAATTEAVTEALTDAGGEWWREDSTDRYKTVRQTAGER